MKNALFLFLSVMWFSSYSQITFQSHTIVDSAMNTDGACAVYTADLDGDGDMDVLTASQYDGKIAWYQNIDGHGNFGIIKTIITDAGTAESVFAADIDGDGDMDVLSASSGANKIAWYENLDGQGNYGEQKNITTNVVGASDVFACDIDGDGDMDVLSASRNVNNIAWYENTDGLGNFNTLQIISDNAPYASSVFAADIDGDGDMDVLSSSILDDKIAWFENTNGLGSFGPQKTITTNADGATSVYAIDIDNDGDIDVLSSSKSDNKIAWYENSNGLGNFGIQQIISTDQDNTESVFAADLDGDGDMDVLSVSDYDGKIAWFKNMDGLGTFGSEQIITTDPSGALDVFACDIDGDGDMDVLSASSSDDIIAWYENIDGFGNFGPLQNLEKTARYAKSVFAIDMDGDGDADVLSASDHYNKIAWYENYDGQGYFNTQHIISTNAEDPRSVFAIDIDGDGDTDVLSASYGDDKIAWYENTDGDGNFMSEQVISLNVLGAELVFAADIDDDNDIDVLATSPWENKIIWFENTNGEGLFDVEHIITTLSNGKGLYAADINSDSSIDVISASGVHEITWYENMNGTGDFGTQQIITSDVYYPTSVFASDIDSDGDIDVLSASEYDNKIAWYENMDGIGAFGAQRIISIFADEAVSVYAADLDNDGDMDVLSASNYDNKIAWYENLDGLGNYGIQHIITTDAHNAESVYAIDIDGDGDIDVLSASEFGSNISWYENLGSLSVYENDLLSFSVFPNPTADLFTIQTQTSIHQIKLYNNLGQLVFEDYNKRIIDISKLKAGLYFLRLEDEYGNIGFRKVIKQI